MEEKFVPYKLALKLKDLGYNEICFTTFNPEGNLIDVFDVFDDILNHALRDIEDCYQRNHELAVGYVTAPLWQDAFDWFRKIHNCKFYIEQDKWNHWCTPMILVSENKDYVDICDSFENYYEAQLACLEMLIEMVTRKHNIKELLLKAYSEGKTIQSNHSGKWQDFVPHNQLDKPNLDYGTLDNWRIKP